MDTILFDLDGTLLPMDQEAYMQIYFAELCKKCAIFGYEEQPIVKAVWAGTKAMVQNDGSKTNEELFWEVFSSAIGPSVLKIKPVLERFYAEEFHAAKNATLPNPKAVTLVRKLKKAGYTVVLATNPLFPLTAIRTRLSWLGLKDNDFDWITSYETSHFAKPNPAYYREILTHIGKTAEDCIMVGNNVQEDGCTAGLGMQFYLVTDSLINDVQQDISQFQNGTFQECCTYFNNMLAC